MHLEQLYLIEILLDQVAIRYWMNFYPIYVVWKENMVAYLCESTLHILVIQFKLIMLIRIYNFD